MFHRRGTERSVRSVGVILFANRGDDEGSDAAFYGAFSKSMRQDFGRVFRRDFHL
jgi:hypothetical protein